MKILVFIPVLCFFIQISANEALPSDGVDDSVGCDKAVHYRVVADFDSDKDQSRQNYLKAIELCPGYIRPYELVGNLYRKENQRDTAISYFKKAAELGTRNHKLYYLLASLLYEKGDLDEADRNIKKSLSIRVDYPKAVKLNREIEKASDNEGPKIILYEPSTPRGMKILKTYENLTVRGIATDKSGVAWVKVNQHETSLDQHGNFLKDIPIQLGTNTIRVEAADSLSYASSALSMEQIRSLSSRIRAKHIIYVMDCCYSGLGLNRSAGVWPGVSDYLRKVSAMRVVQIITAGGQGEQVQEKEGHGLFTTYFLKAIQGEADIDKDNVVTGTELGAYLRPTVSNASRQAQTPLFGRLEGEGEFLFLVKKEK